MRKILSLFVLLLMPTLVSAQALINCVQATNTPCTTAGAPAVKNAGDPAWLAFGKANQNFNTMIPYFNYSLTQDLQTTKSFFSTELLNVPSTTAVGCPLNGIPCPVFGQQSFGWVGTLTGAGTAGSFAPIWFDIVHDNFANSTGLVNLMQLDHYFGGPLATGGFGTLNVTLHNDGGATGNFGRPSAYVSETLGGRLDYNDNGYANTYNGTSGSLFGFNINVGIQCNSANPPVQPCATNMRGLIGEEIDIAAYAHTSLLAVIGSQIVEQSPAVTGGVEENIGIALSNDPAAFGWDMGFAIGNFDGNPSINSTGTVLGCWPHSVVRGSTGACGTAANGVKLSNMTFSSNAFESLNFGVDGVGNLTANQIIVGSNGINGQSATLSSITITSAGSYIGRNSLPSIFIQAPTAGGTQAVASVTSMNLTAAVPLTAGTGASNGDTLTLSGGAGTQATLTLGVGSFNGFIVGNTLHITSGVPVSGTTVAVGQLLAGAGITAGTYISSENGATGTQWLVNFPQTVASAGSPEAMTLTSVTIATPGSYTGVTASPTTTGGTASVQPTFSFGFGIAAINVSNSGSGYLTNPLPLIYTTAGYVNGDLFAAFTPVMTPVVSDVDINPGIIFTNNQVYSGASSASNSWMFMSQSLSGTSSDAANGITSPFNISISGDSVDTTTNGSGDLIGFSVRTAASTNHTGGREAFQSYLNVVGTPAISPGAAGYVGGQNVLRINTNLTGSTGAYANYKGGVFASNANVFTQSGATFLSLVNGEEFDVAVATGSSTAEKHGMTIVKTSTDAVRAVYDDSALQFDDQDGTASTWLYGLEFGAYAHKWPFGSDSTLIFAQSRQTGPASSSIALNGVDWSNVTFQSGGCAYKSTGYCIDPSGNNKANSFVAGGTTFTVTSGTGACDTGGHRTSLTGGATAGSLVCSGTTGASTIVLALPTATNGWACYANDDTAKTSLGVGVVTTSAATISGTITSGDKIVFGCIGY